MEAVSLDYAFATQATLAVYARPRHHGREAYAFGSVVTLRMQFALQDGYFPPVFFSSFFNSFLGTSISSVRALLLLSKAVQTHSMPFLRSPWF